MKPKNLRLKYGGAYPICNREGDTFNRALSLRSDNIVAKVVLRSNMKMRIAPQLAPAKPTGILLALVATLFAASAQSQPAHPMPPADRAAIAAALEAYDRGNAAQAEPALRSLALRYPASYEVNEALGSLYAEASQLDRALPYLERASTLQPRAALAHANLGAVFLKLSRTDEAARELERAAKLDPTNPQTQSSLGQVLLLQKHPAEAARAFAAASDRNPTDVDLKYNHALALYESSANREAASVLASIPALSMTAEMHALAADAEERSGDFVKALSHFEAAARLDPTDANLYAFTVELLRHWNWEEAIKVADYAISRYPASRHFPIASGIAYYSKNDYASAVRIFAALLQQDPSDATVADLLGRSCSALPDGENPDCTAVFQYALAHPGNAVMMTYGAIAILHAPRDPQNDAQQLNQAESLLKSAIAADPSHAEAYLRLAVVEQLRSHWAESATLLERSLALNPNSPEAHYRLSRAYVRLGRKEEAQQQIVLRESCAKQAKASLDARMQEIMRFVFNPG